MVSRSDNWPAAPSSISIDDDIHIWRAHLRQDPATVQRLYEILNPDERRRADKYHFQKDRDHFVVARGALREILSAYIRISPARIRFSYNRYGKPALSDGEPFADLLRFSVSHSHGIALYGLTQGREIGIDIEHIRADFASLDIAEHFFSPAEVESLRAVPANQQTDAFFCCWSRKEAYIKALGKGLSHPLKEFAVSLAPGLPARLLNAGNDPHETARWSMLELFPADGYAAALVVEGALRSLKFWQWNAFNVSNA